MVQKLSRADVAEYRETGIHSPVRIFTPDEALKLRQAVESEEAERGPIFSEDRPRPGDPFQGSYRFKSHLLFKWLADAVRDPRILDLVEPLTGPDILCWTTHWFIKEAGTSNYVSWHQDSNYWGVETDNLVTAWLALSPATVESGCIRFLPGSHKGPAMEHIDTFAADNMLTRGQTIEGMDESKAVNIELQPGEVALFDYRLAHASDPNRSNDRRIGVGIRYVPTSARQVRSDWDSASLVRGVDNYGHFELEPEPREDFDPAAVAMHEKADKAQRKIYYRDDDGASEAAATA
ncbi:MAG: phytanoyl-CoA dioxygenase family protein [Pseudomonadota bacterium]